MSKSETYTDPRVLRTRQMLRDALIALIQENGFEAIKVRDITDRATLNRATFYLHYRDKYDLLIKSMYDLLEELETEVGLPAFQGREINVDAILKPLTLVFEYFTRHATFYRVMLCEVGVPSIIVEMQRYLENVALRWMRQLHPDQKRAVVEPDMVIKFVSTAYIGVLRWWLENDMPHSAEHMAKHFMNLVSLGIFRSIGLEVPNEIPA
jgi:AcrR family transcriptional regulator